MPEVARVAIAYDCLFPLDAGGGERVYDALAERFVGRGWDVDYVTRTQWSEADSPVRPYQVHGVWRGDIHDATGDRTSGSALAFAFALFRWFRRHGRHHDLAVVAALPVLNVFAVRLALLGSGVPIVTDWLEVWGARKWREYAGPLVGTVATVLQWLGLRVGRVQTVNSAFTARRIRAIRPAADPVVLGLVDLAGLEPRRTAPARPPVALFVGRHIADKRLADLPAALAVARERVPGLRAVVTGRGPES
ncbi:glycosyltransferase, partial [Agromyces seonyuensis]|uniref:glycosyltransferase n=1 Tax=Agromyces seonyuensis TaxID=2662446 RepID=UPI0013660846